MGGDPEQQEEGDNFCCNGECLHWCKSFLHFVFLLPRKIFHQCKRVLNNISLSTSHGEFLHCITWNHFQLEFCQIKGVISNPKNLLQIFAIIKGSSIMNFGKQPQYDFPKMRGGSHLIFVTTTTTAGCVKNFSQV